MRIAATILLIIFAGSMLFGVLAIITPQLIPYVVTIVFWLYILIGAVVLGSVLFQTKQMLHMATARHTGGFYLQVQMQVTKTAEGKSGGIRRGLAGFAEALVIAISWPLVVITNKMQRAAIKRSQVPSLPNIYTVFLNNFLALNARAITILLLCGFTYLTAIYTPLDKHGIQLFFWLCIVFCNSLLILFVLIPGGISKMIRQQPFNPTIQILILLVSIGWILILSYTTLQHATLMTNPATVAEVAYSIFMTTPNPLELLRKSDWKIVDISALGSTALFSAIIIQTFLWRHKDLKRTDVDYLTLAVSYVNLGAFLQAKEFLNKIQPSADSFALNGAVCLLKGDRTKDNN